MFTGNYSNALVPSIVNVPEGIPRVASTTTGAETRVSDASLYPRHAHRRVPLLLVAIAVVLALIAALGGYETVKRRHPTFRAQAVISLDQPLKVAQSNSSAELDKLARLRATYIGAVKFDTVVDAVAKETRLTPGQVRARVFAVGEPSTLLLVVGARDRTGVSARRIATALANEMIAYSQQTQDKFKIPDKDRVLATIVVQPKTAKQISPTRRKALTAGLVAGIIVFLVIMGLGTLARRPR